MRLTMLEMILIIMIMMFLPTGLTPHPKADENNYVRDDTDNNDNDVLTYRSKDEFHHPIEHDNNNVRDDANNNDNLCGYLQG
jgi:hypothetical protein